MGSWESICIFNICIYFVYMISVSVPGLGGALEVILSTALNAHHIPK